MNAILIAFGLIASVHYAVASTSPISTTTVPLTISEMVHESADKYGVDEEIMKKVIACESSNDPTRIGDNGTSYGLVQIHLPAHPDISKAQALDPQFAADFMASEFSTGHAYYWTCYRILYMNKLSTSSDSESKSESI